MFICLYPDKHQLFVFDGYNVGEIILNTILMFCIIDNGKGPVLVYYTNYPNFLKLHEFNWNSYDHVAEVLLVHNC